MLPCPTARRMDMNVTVRFGSVAVLKRRFRFMRFGFSDGSCGSVRGSWRYQSPSPKSVENNTFWSLGGMAAERGSTQFGSLGPDACEKGTFTRAWGVHNSGVWPPRGGVHNSGVWGLKFAKRVLREGPAMRAAGKGPAARGSTQFGSLWPGACEKATPMRVAGEGPAMRGSTQFGSLGLKLAERVLPHVLLGRPRVAGEYTIREFGAWSLRKGAPTRAAGPRAGVYNSGVWGLELAKRALLRVCWGGARGWIREFGAWSLQNGYSHACCWAGAGSAQFGSLGPGACEKGAPHACCWEEYTIREFGA